MSQTALLLTLAVLAARAQALLARIPIHVEALMRKIANLAQYLLFRRRTAYRRLFLGPDGRLNDDGRIIVAHLARLCRAVSSKGVVGQGPFGPRVDANATLIAVGRNEVFEALMKELSLPHEAVYAAVQEEHETVLGYSA